MELTIDKKTAKRLYAESPEWFRNELVEKFGEKTFTEESYEKVKTFEDACNIVGVDPGSIFHKEDTVDEIAYKKLKIIAKAINGGWVPNWNNTNQYKWFPYFRLSSGFGFSGSHFSYALAYASVGSRLCFESEEKADYAGTQFEDLYKDLLTILNN